MALEQVQSHEIEDLPKLNVALKLVASNVAGCKFVYF